jgi:hypothetical protein
VSTINALELRKRLGRQWVFSRMQFGGGSWVLECGNDSIIVTDGLAIDDRGGPVRMWRHASISRADRMPDYADLVMLHKAAFGDGWAYQVFAPPSAHVSGAAIGGKALHTLHLWGLVDGEPVLPNFGESGAI